MPQTPLPKLAAIAAWAAACLPRPVAAGGEGVWWSHEFEYFHFECYVLIILVLLALLVDTVHHRLAHLAKGARAWRGDEGDASREVHRESQVPLWELLFEASVGELMVMGCVAIIVWSASRAGIFDVITKALKGYNVVALPGDSTTYLHAVEDVHMQLFMAMMLYIGVMALTVRGTMRAEMTWEAADDRLASVRSEGGDVISDVPEREIKEFDRTRNEFLASIEDWRGGTWVELDQHLEPILQSLPEAEWQVFSPVVSTSPHGGQSALEKGEVHHFGEHRTSVVDLLEDWFPFDEYLALECRFLVHNLAQVKPWTWAFISLSMLIKAQLLKVTRSGAANYCFDAFIMVALIIFSVVSQWQIRRSYRVLKERRLKRSGSKGPHRSTRMSRISKKDSRPMWKRKMEEVIVKADAHISYPWVTALNLLQIVLFFTSLHVVRFTTLRQWWELELARSLACFAVALLGVPLLGIGLGRAIPKLSVVLARADFMQERHIQWLEVILQDHCSGRDHVFNPARRLSENLITGLASQHFEAPSPIEGLYNRTSRVSRTSLASGSKNSANSTDRLCLHTIVAARRAAAQERRASLNSQQGLLIPTQGTHDSLKCSSNRSSLSPQHQQQSNQSPKRQETRESLKSSSQHSLSLQQHLPLPHQGPQRQKSSPELPGYVSHKSCCGA